MSTFNLKLKPMAYAIMFACYFMAREWQERQHAEVSRNEHAE